MRRISADTHYHPKMHKIYKIMLKNNVFILIFSKMTMSM